MAAFRILTLNTWQERGPWRERWELIFAGLKFYLPDIIGFQEIFNEEWMEEIRQRSGYPHLVRSGRHSGLIFLSKYPALESECRIMKNKSPIEDYDRYAHYALFKAGRKKLAVFNTHLSWQLQDDESRLKQTEELLDFVRQKTAGDWKRFFRNIPAVILGDFNSAPDKLSIQVIQEVWQDTFAVLHPGNPGLTWDYQNPFAERIRDEMPERRIDYIFTQGISGQPRRAEIVFNQPDSNGVYPSDHFGVLTEIEL